MPVLNRQKGQILVEGILLMSLLLFITIWATRQMKERKWMENLVQSPWVYIAGMIETGEWLPAAQGKKLHPNNLEKNRTYDPRRSN